MEYKVVYLLGLSQREVYKDSFNNALSYAEQLFSAGIKYACIKDECNSILVEFENLG